MRAELIPMLVNRKAIPIGACAIETDPKFDDPNSLATIMIPNAEMNVDII